jgi:hypothetical protein
MKVEMAFNNAAITASGYQKADIYRTIKNAFLKRGLRCSSENELLSFEDTGHEDDYAHMWKVIISLLKSEWFVKCASSCTFIDDDAEEDVLSQAWKVQQRRA